MFAFFLQFIHAIEPNPRVRMKPLAKRLTHSLCVNVPKVGKAKPAKKKVQKLFSLWVRSGTDTSD